MRGGFNSNSDLWHRKDESCQHINPDSSSLSVRAIIDSMFSEKYSVTSKLLCQGISFGAVQ